MWYLAFHAFLLKKMDGSPCPAQYLVLSIHQMLVELKESAWFLSLHCGHIYGIFLSIFSDCSPPHRPWPCWFPSSSLSTSFFIIIFLDVDHFLLNLLQYCFCCMLFDFFWSQGMWDLGSPTRAWTHTPSFRRRSLNH